MTVLREHYKISCVWKQKQYLRMNLDWDNSNRKVHLSMLAYVTDALTRFRHNHHQKTQHQPYLHIKQTYGAKSQYAEAADVSTPLIKEDKCFL